MDDSLTTKAVLALAVFALWAAGPINAETIYVDDGAPPGGDGTAWADAYRDLQAALAHASTNGAVTEIRVARGVYPPAGSNGVRTATFQLLNNLALYGGYAGLGAPDPDFRDVDSNASILSGDLNGNDGPDFANNDENSYHVVTGSGTDATAVLDGFTIVGGNGNGSYPNNAAGGMYNNAGSPTVRNCTFTGNSAGYGGGMLNEYSDPTLTDCAFPANAATTDGGGMYNYYNSSPTLTECTFSGNSADDDGGGMYNYDSANPTLTNCVFRRNSSAYAGGGICNGSGGPALINCVFSGNTAYNGGGIHNYYNSSPALINCVINGNSALFDGGGIHSILFTRPTLTNCILWGNTDAGGMDESAQIYGGTPDIDYSCVWDWTGSLGGTGNIGGDPLFVDADGPDGVVGTDDDNLRLSAGSPCIDAGSNGAVPPDAADLDNDGDTAEPIPFDLDRNPRFVDDPATPDTGAGLPPIVDIGAYEYIPRDVDGDGDVDLADFAVFADCLAGPEATPAPTLPNVTVITCLLAFDADVDADVDLSDFAGFQAIFGR